MRTYGELFRVREFRTLFGTNCLTHAALTLNGLALGTLTYELTGSPALTALAMFGSPLVSVIGSLTLLSAADSLPPRRALILSSAAGALFATLQAVPGLPLWLRFAALAAMALVRSVTSGSKPAMLVEILPDGAFVFGRATLNISVGAMQMVGYGVGGLLLVVFSPSRLFLLAALMSAGSVLWFRLGLADRPARSAERTGLRQTVRVNRYLWSGRLRRPLLVALWVPGGLMVGCQALFVPYAAEQAGFLLAAAALGMLASDVVIGRFLRPRFRDRLIRPLHLLLAVPYLLFVFQLPLLVAVGLTAVASCGFAAILPLQNRLLDNSDPRVHGQVLGLFHNGFEATSALGAALAGLAAEWLSPGSARAAMAVLSLAVTVALVPGLRRSKPSAHPAGSPHLGA